MPTFIAVQNTYHLFEMALFNNETLIEHRHDTNRNASRTFISLLDDLLKNNNQTLHEISCIVANQGPAPFSTLRVVLTSVNGLHFATSIPLIGIDGLDATFFEYYDPQYQQTVVLLNAFNVDVYFAIHEKDHLKKGYKKIDKLLEELSKTFPGGTVHFFGNASDMYRQNIHAVFGDRALFLDHIPAMCTIKQISKMGLAQWKKQKEFTKQLLPLHLKKHPVEIESI